ncbi:MAG: hypothetical protein ACYDCK_08280 [Thermoplasmatota archaeon]
MLEPFVRLKTGQLFWGIATLVAAIASAMPTGVTTRGDFVPAYLLFPAVAVFALLRFAGLSVARWQGRETMGIGYRIASWGALALAVFLLGFLEGGGLIALVAYFALDLVGGLTKRRPRAGAAAARRARGSGWRTALIVTAVAVGFVAFHFFVALRFEFGLLLDWSYVVLAVGVALRLLLAGPRPGGEHAERPPAAHRIHARTERALAEPFASRLRSAFDAFLDEGDAGPMLDAAVLLASLKGANPDRAREEVMGVLSRAGTSRAEDLAAAIEVLENPS